MAYIKLCNINKTFTTKKKESKVLKKLNLEIEKGELVVIYGESNTGKTSLLDILSLLDLDFNGDYFLNDKNINDYEKKDLNKFINNNITYLNSETYLVNNLTIKENIELSTELYKNSYNSLEVIKKLALTRKKDYYPNELSSGDKLKATLAVKLSKKTEIILCDEITALLDSKCKKQVLKFLQELSKKNTTVIIATHNKNICSIANKVITLKTGTIEKVKINKKVKNVGDVKW